MYAEMGGGGAYGEAALLLGREVPAITRALFFTALPAAWMTFIGWVFQLSSMFVEVSFNVMRWGWAAPNLRNVLRQPSLACSGEKEVSLEQASRSFLLPTA
jgi:hypothetical protein